jgi:hypothetical protein
MKSLGVHMVESEFYRGPVSGQIGKEQRFSDVIQFESEPASLPPLSRRAIDAITAHAILVQGIRAVHLEKGKIIPKNIARNGLLPKP